MTMRFKIGPSARDLTDDDIAALYDLTSYGEESGPGISSRGGMVIVTREHGTLFAIQGAAVAEYDRHSCEWSAWSHCDACGYQFRTTAQDPASADCPRCTARATKDTGEW